MTNEFILQDRIQKIQQIINKYGEENFYISFSGGKDSTVLSTLIDMSIPDNKIPRVYADTGIELNMIHDFVIELSRTDDRIEIIKPNTPIKEMLENVGYPFKSKEHSLYLSVYQKNKKITKSVDRYLNPEESRKTFGCPKILKYQFTDDFNIHVSRKCCDELKKKPLHRWQKEHNKKYTIIGVMQSEGGARKNAHCLAFKNNKLYAFQPLTSITKEWFIEKYNIKICDIYKTPYNFERTGCKGCPYNLHLQESLKVLEKYFPNERKQCEYIWKPVYDEYRRLNYRLKKGNKDD